MDITELSNQKIGILGFGQEGQAILKYLHAQNATAVIFDERAETEWTPEAKAMASDFGASIISGADYLDTIGDCTLVFRSPGIWRQHPQILAAEQKGTIITSQAKWFFEHSPAKIIGVTGTKGKGTTCSLIHEILSTNTTNSGNVYLTGNIGKTQPLEFLNQTTATDLVVYELSSFQLQDLTQSPHIGVCLMTTSDHLNHHQDLAEYHEAKAAISAYQVEGDVSIYNVDYEASAKIGQMGNGRKLEVSKQELGDKLGALISGSTIILNCNSEPVTLDCSNRKLRGDHNLENVAAAALVGLVLGINVATIDKAVNNFPGLEHRLQLVKEVGGVSYYNDSISTVPETTMAAVNSFTEPIHLLLGGSDKGLEYDMLVTTLANTKNIASISLLGELGLKLKQLLVAQDLGDINIFGPYTDLNLAMTEIKANTKAGDIVLLSPASASFDMFKNYADRGNKYVEIVSSY